MTGRRTDRRITAKEAARILGVPLYAVYKMLSDGRLTRYKHLAGVRLSENEVRRHKDEHLQRIERHD